VLLPATVRRFLVAHPQCAVGGSHAAQMAETTMETLGGPPDAAAPAARPPPDDIDVFCGSGALHGRRTRPMDRVRQLSHGLARSFATRQYNEGTWETDRLDAAFELATGGVRRLEDERPTSGRENYLDLEGARALRRYTLPGEIKVDLVHVVEDPKVHRNVSDWLSLISTRKANYWISPDDRVVFSAPHRWCAPPMSQAPPSPSVAR